MGGPEARHRWRFLSKFGFAAGTGTYEIRLRSRDPAAQGSSIHLDLDVLPDEEMFRVGSMPPCQHRADGALHTTHKLLKVGGSGEWGPWQGASASQSPEPRTLFFALSSCSYLTPEHDVDYELRLRQPDHSELSAELRHAPATGALALLWLTAALACLARRCRRLRQIPGAVHSVASVQVAAVALQWAARLLMTLHVWVNLVAGRDAGGAGMVAEAFSMLSQAVSSTLLIAVAQGYVLRTKAEEVDLVRPICLMVGIFHLVLAGVGDSHCDSFEQFHLSDDGSAAWVPPLVRLLLALWFFSGLRALHRAGCNLPRGPLLRLRLAGCAHFLAAPALAASVRALAPCLRHPVMELGLVCAQTASVFWLADLLLLHGQSPGAAEPRASLLPRGAGRPVPVPLKS